MTGYYNFCKPCAARQYLHVITNYAMFDPIKYLFPKLIAEYHSTKITRTEWFGWCGYTERQLIDRISYTLGDTSWFSAAVMSFHLDHVKPRWLFNIEYFGDEEFKACWALNNLRLVPMGVDFAKGQRWKDEDGYIWFKGNDGEVCKKRQKRFKVRLIA